MTLSVPELASGEPIPAVRRCAHRAGGTSGVIRGCVQPGHRRRLRRSSPSPPTPTLVNITAPIPQNDDGNNRQVLRRVPAREGTLLARRYGVARTWPGSSRWTARQVTRAISQRSVESYGPRPRGPIRPRGHSGRFAAHGGFDRGLWVTALTCRAVGKQPVPVAPSSAPAGLGQS